MAKAGGDGQWVNIPTPLHSFDGVTESSSPGGLLDCRSWPEEAGQVNPSSALVATPRVEKRIVYGQSDPDERASKKNL